MDSSKPAPSSLGAVARAITKILHFRRLSAISGGAAVSEFSFNYDDDDAKLKPSEIVGSEPPRDEASKAEEDEAPGCSNREAMESLLANLFAGVSAVKAAYAQLQVAQSPYDPESIQSADQLIVAEIRNLSELKQSYLKKQQPSAASPAPLAAQIEEQRNLLKTYKITTHKLESEIKSRDSEILSLQADLLDSERRNRLLDSRLHPGRSLSSLDDLHLSGLNPTHFLTALRCAVKSVRTFVKQNLIREMEAAGWDLSAAATSIQPDVVRPEHRHITFESYVFRRMFSGFHLKDFGVASLSDRASWSRERFFGEFARLRSVKPQSLVTVRKGDGLSGFRKFLRERYLTAVHPAMEAAFFGDLDQRGLLSSGRGLPASEFFGGFAEVARRVWVLHCLFFAFGEAAELFSVERGSRFSEVYMESAVEEGGHTGMVGVAAGAKKVVGFTVVPGFRVGGTVIQCKVYLSDGRT